MYNYIYKSLYRVFENRKIGRHSKNWETLKKLGDTLKKLGVRKNKLVGEMYDVRMTYV